MTTAALRTRSEAVYRRSRIEPPFRRKALFESLEQRLLLSADPLASVSSEGLLHAQFGDDADRVTVRQVSTAAGGGVIVDLTAGALTQRYGGDGAGIMAVELRGGGGDDSFELIGLSVGATVAGEGGLDSLFGEAANSEWFINGLDAGSIGMATF